MAIANNLQGGKTYVFGVRGTDEVGNQGNPVTYIWKVGQQTLFAFPNNDETEYRQVVIEIRFRISFSSLLLYFLPKAIFISFVNLFLFLRTNSPF